MNSLTLFFRQATAKEQENLKKRKSNPQLHLTECKYVLATGKQTKPGHSPPRKPEGYFSPDCTIKWTTGGAAFALLMLLYKLNSRNVEMVGESGTAGYALGSSLSNIDEDETIPQWLTDMVGNKWRTGKNSILDFNRPGKSFRVWIKTKNLENNRIFIFLYRKQWEKVSDEEVKEIARELLNIWGKKWNVPFDRNKYFIGREETLDEIDNKLTTSTRSPSIHSAPLFLSGLPGIGKTQIVLEYACRHYLTNYDAVFWVDAKSRESILVDYANIANYIQGNKRDSQNTDQKQPSESMGAKSRWILCFDFM